MPLAGNVMSEVATRAIAGRTVEEVLAANPALGGTGTECADYLDNEETIAEYITAALDDPNPK